MEATQSSELQPTPIFAGVEEEDWPDLLAKAVRLEVAPGEAVFHEGEEADSIYVVLAGTVEVRAKAQKGAAETVLAQLGAGAVLGETSLFLEGIHSASIYAAEPSTVLRFHKEPFVEMVLQRHRGAVQVLYNIAHTLSVRLRAADEHIAAIVVPTGPLIENAARQRKIF